MTPQERRDEMVKKMHDLEKTKKAFFAMYNAEFGNNANKSIDQLSLCVRSSGTILFPRSQLSLSQACATIPKPNNKGYLCRTGASVM